MAKWALLKTVLPMLAIIGVCAAQRESPFATRPATLRVLVTVDGETEKANQVTVELMDSLGLGSAMNSKLTDNAGSVVFQTTTGDHRIRITGPDIQTYEGELEIARNETSHIERIRVSAAPLPNQAAPSIATNSVVPAIRLNVPAAARKAYDQAAEAMRQQHWEKSRTLFESAIREYPQYDMAYNGLGAVEMQLNDVEAARKAFAKAIELNPDFAGANRNMARLLLVDHKNNEALPLLLRSLATEPDSVWALVNAANSEFLLRNYTDAVLYARKAHALPHKDFATVHIVAARALEATRQSEEAIGEYRLYLSEAPKGPDAPRAQAAINRLSIHAPQ